MTGTTAETELVDPNKKRQREDQENLPVVQTCKIQINFPDYRTEDG